MLDCKPTYGSLIGNNISEVRNWRVGEFPGPSPIIACASQNGNTPISKWRNAKDLGKLCCSIFKPAKSPQSYFITYNQSLFDYLQNNVSIIKFDPVLAFISQILASC